MLISAITKTICHKCDESKDRYVNVEKFNAGEAKCKCGGTLGSVTYGDNHSKRWNPPIIDRTLGYYDDQLGSYIGSTSDKRRICKEKGWVEIKTGEVDQIKRKPEKTVEQKTQEYKHIIKESAYKANFPLSGV